MPHNILHNPLLDTPLTHSPVYITPQPRFILIGWGYGIIDSNSVSAVTVGLSVSLNDLTTHQTRLCRYTVKAIDKWE